MPELPEVETVRRGLLKHLPGRTITRVIVHRPDSIGFPEPEQFVRGLKGHRFIDIRRRGKYLVFELDKGAALGAHLRMSGRLLVGSRKKASADHIRVTIQLDDAQELLFEDMRVFGRLWYVPRGAKPEQVISGLADLGVEPLEGLSASYLKEAFKNRTQAIKTALLDQTVIAGIGNIYADESLHLARIHPLTPAKQLKTDQLALLADVVQQVLARAIGLGGSSLRNYTDSEGVNGNYQHSSCVYGREGKPCQRCGSEIVRIKISGRSAHFCPSCQPAPRGVKTQATGSKRSATSKKGSRNRSTR